jgi:iron complex transport system ATP-binding protein
VKPILLTGDLSLERGGRCLVRDLDLQIRPGECWMVIGPNGSGKTTLLKAIAGLITADAGDIQLSGTSLRELDARQRALRLGLVFQHGNAGLHNSTLELVMSGHHPRRRHWWDTPGEIETAQQALTEVGLGGLARQDSQTLSGGELRRAEIARLLVQDPTLALLDEPFNHLDIGQQVAMIRLLKRHFLRPQHALLMVVHDLNMVTQAASHCLLLYGDGRWAAGPVAEIATRETLSELYHYPVEEYRAPGGPLWTVAWEPKSQG